MCGRVIQSSGPLRYAIVDGMNVRDSRVHNYPPRWNGAPSQELLVIRRNHQTREPQPIYQQGARARCAARLRAQGSRCEGVSPHPGGVGPYAPMAGVPGLARGLPTIHTSFWKPSYFRSSLRRSLSAMLRVRRSSSSSRSACAVAVSRPLRLSFARRFLCATTCSALSATRASASCKWRSSVSRSIGRAYHEQRHVMRAWRVSMRATARMLCEKVTHFAAAYWRR
jgi:hypothetical protein